MTYAELQEELEFQKQLNAELVALLKSKDNQIDQHLQWNMLLADERDAFQNQVHELEKQLLELRRNAR